MNPNLTFWVFVWQTRNFEYFDKIFQRSLKIKVDACFCLSFLKPIWRIYSIIYFSRFLQKSFHNKLFRNSIFLRNFRYINIFVKNTVSFRNKVKTGDCLEFSVKDSNADFFALSVFADESDAAAKSFDRNVLKTLC